MTSVHVTKTSPDELALMSDKPNRTQQLQPVILPIESAILGAVVGFVLGGAAMFAFLIHVGLI